jgi:catechol 2,3-dioxygenase-like lactoylglutathione lyase family enzyme
MPKIAIIRIRCQNPKGLLKFYHDILGMELLADDVVGYGGAEAALQFLPGTEPYQPGPHDLYWKVALAVPNIELAHQQLTEKGVSVGVPRQFRDVGYLAHFQDPEGFTIELIEHSFEGERRDEPIDPKRLGGGAHLNLLTLRTADIRPIQEACAAWGMRQLSIQPVECNGFTLYFFAFTDEQPPSSNLMAIENRTWVYQRPYTVLEVQHLHDAEQVLKISGSQSGYLGAQVMQAPEIFTGAGLLGFERA